MSYIKGSENEIQLATQVLDKLYQTVGDQRFPKPKIQIIQNDTVIAAYEPGSKKILLNESVFEVCRSMGKDSLATLAFIISHELVHFFQNQLDITKESCPFLAYDTQYAQQVRIEKAADVSGVFIAYLSGYLTSGDLVPLMIKRLYETFNLKNKKLQQYEDFDQRMQIAEEVKLKADTLRHIFKFGNLNILLSETEMATACFQYVLQYYQGSEIYNNLALANILAGMNIGNKQVDSYIFPLELDYETKLSQVRAESDGLTSEEQKSRQYFFQLASSFLDTALIKNPNYEKAMLNKLCLYTLTGQPQRAIEYYKRVSPKIANTTEQNKFDLALVNAYLLLDQQDAVKKAEKIIENLKDQNTEFARLASFNLVRYKNETWNQNRQHDCSTSLEHEKLTTESNQFQYYDQIPLFRLNRMTKIGWKTEGKVTRWVGKWRNEKIIHLLEINKKLKNHNFYNKSLKNWTLLPECQLILRPATVPNWEVVLIE